MTTNFDLLNDQLTEAHNRIKELETQLQATASQHDALPNLFGLVLDTIPERVFWKDRNSVYLGCNQAFAEDAGLASPAEIIGKTDYDTPWAETEADAYRNDDKHVMDTGEVRIRYEEPQTRPDGSVFWLETSKIPLRDANGEVIGVLGTYTDITDRKKAEQELKNSQRLLELVLDTIPERVFWKDKNSVYLGANQAFAEDAGLTSPSQLIGKTDYDTPWADTEADAYRADDKHVMDTDEVRIRYEESQTRADGSISWVETSKIPLHDSNGNTIGVLGTYADITARKTAEQELENSRRLLELVIDNIPERVFWKDKDLNYLGVNQAFAEDAGLDSPADLIGKSDYDMPWGDAEAEMYRADDKHVMETDEARIRYEEPQTRPDGSNFWLETSKIPLHNSNGDIIGILGTYADITDRKEAEQEREQLINDLQIAQRVAEENSRLKSEFLSTMSHELRTPLNAIEGFTSIMLGGMGIELSPRAEDMVTRISSNSKRLLALINDFLDLSRIESGRLDLIEEPLNIQSLVQDWRNGIDVLADKKQLDLNVHIADGFPTSILGDEDALSKVAVNLLSNAVKFTNEGHVTLTIDTADDNMWRLIVTDTGIGIPPHAREYIFDEFRQVDGSSKRVYGGTGLGLALVNKLVRAMGGSVLLESEIDEGSTFTVTLPLNLPTENE